jgi:COMPASS component SWD2
VSCVVCVLQIRYLSLHDNRYLRVFQGHSRSVVAVEMSPKEDVFASASLDGTIRIWDLRSTDCQAAMHFSGEGERPAVAFDPQGVVLAAAISGGQTKVRAE